MAAVRDSNVVALSLFDNLRRGPGRPTRRTFQHPKSWRQDFAALGVPGEAVSGARLHSHTQESKRREAAGAVAEGLVQTPTATISDMDPMGESSGDSETEDRKQVPEPMSLPTNPRLLSGLELSQVNWKALHQGQEWRRELLLRGLPVQLCEKGRLEAFLAAHGLEGAASKVRIFRGKASKLGSAVVLATSADAAARLAKFFHGSQLAGSSMPIAVSFSLGQASGAPRRRAEAPTGVCLDAEPMRVQSQSGACAPRALAQMRLRGGVPPPPGLEDFLPVC
mmetsp:Transcript_126426/g.393470  ORF Transcript_126426/g.393470 Transcript_126426/m.393470 type:complete len:280 (+) Transcript_126426:94-933(+)